LDKWAYKLDQPFKLQTWKKGWQLAENAAMFILDKSDEDA
jgi:hypothetical protein